MSVAALAELVMKGFQWVMGLSFLWKVVRNMGTLRTAVKAIEDVYKEIEASGRKIPNVEEAQTVLNSLSNILKTGVIDIAGIDDYKIAAGLDEINHNLQLSLKDSLDNPVLVSPVITKGDK